MNNTTHKIGFTVEQLEDKLAEVIYTTVQEQIAPRKSMVEVYFDERGVSYTYFNDRFQLNCGDMVYVEGALEGVRGRVTDVNYNFKIKVSDYKRVIAVVDTNVSGQFFLAGSHVLAFDREALPVHKVRGWFKAPDKEDEEYVSGSDETAFFLDDLKGMNVRSVIAERGHNYYVENRVSYLCIDGTSGYAIVEGNEAYEVEFEYRDGEIRNLVCSCFCNYNCKHEFAAMLQLRETLDIIRNHYSEEYERSGYFVAISKGTLFEFAVMNKETGCFNL